MNKQKYATGFKGVFQLKGWNKAFEVKGYKDGYYFVRVNKWWDAKYTEAELDKMISNAIRYESKSATRGKPITAQHRANMLAGIRKRWNKLPGNPAIREAYLQLEALRQKLIQERNAKAHGCTCNPGPRPTRPHNMTTDPTPATKDLSGYSVTDLVTTHHAIVAELKARKGKIQQILDAVDAVIA